VIENLIKACCNYDELETLELFIETIMPLTEDLPAEKLAWRKKEWQKSITDYIDYMEKNSDRYAYSRRNEWRNRYKDEAAHFRMRLEYYDSEQNFVEHLELHKKSEERKQRLEAKLEEISRSKTPAVDTERVLNQENEDNKVYHFVGIVFPHGGQVYSYLTKEENINVGDHVIVQTSHGEAKVKVVSVTSCLRSAAPYSVDKAKYILRKAEDNE